MNKLHSMSKAVRASIFTLGCLLALAGASSAQTTHRPISDFVNAQTNTLYWIDPANWEFVIVDFTGEQANLLALFGGPVITPVITGDVTERKLANGGTHVHVVLDASNALAAAGDGWNGVSWIGGAWWEIVFLGNTPALGSCHVVFDWDTTEAPGGETLNWNDVPALSMAFSGNVSGPLTSTAPWTASTLGYAQTTQRGIAGKVQGHWGYDGFSTEKVFIGPVAP